MTNGMPDSPIETIAETENYSVWASDEPDGETTYHLELGPVTVHFFTEEWDDFVDLVRDTGPTPEADEGESDELPAVEVELDWGSLYFSSDEWSEFYRLIEQVD